MGTPERQWSARMAQHKNISAGCLKRPFSKAAASEEARRTLRYVEPLSDARTMLADFFSILLEARHVCFPQGRLYHRLCQVVCEPAVQGPEYYPESGNALVCQTSQIQYEL